MQTVERPLVDPDGLYRLSDLIGRRDPATGKRVDPIVPASPATIYRWMNSGDFPRPIQLGVNLVAWRGHTLNQWMESRAVDPTTPRK